MARLTTHAPGGLTENDFELARRVDAVAWNGMAARWNGMAARVGPCYSRLARR